MRPFLSSFRPWSEKTEGPHHSMRVGGPPRHNGRRLTMVADLVSRVVGGAFLATAGWGLGGYITDTWAPERYVLWAFGLAISGALIGLISTPFVLGRLYGSIAERTRTIPTSRMLSGIVGVTMGLLLALALFHSSLADSRLARHHIPYRIEPSAGVPGWDDNVLPIPRFVPEICSRTLVPLSQRRRS